MHAALEHAAAAIEAPISRATGTAMHHHESAGRWSPADIIEHLALSYAGTARSMRKALEKDRPIGHPPTLRHRLAQLIVVSLGYFPRAEAPEGTRPAGLAPSTALTAFRNNLVEMDAAITECERRFGPRAIVADHPILGGLTASGWRRFHLQHARHHAKQIQARLAG